MAMPLIAITTSELRKPGSSEVATPAHSQEPGGRRDLALALAYPGAVSRGGGAPLIVPPFAHEDDVESILDRFELGFVRRTLERDLPLLGICRGAELMNVARGGTLIQHVEGHRQTEEARVPTHDVRIEAGSRLAEVIGEERVGVNTFHHQAVDALGGGVRAVAWSDDDLVEAIELVGPEFAIGVQWHAEGLIDEPHHCALFAKFVAAANRYRTRAVRPRAA